MKSLKFASLILLCATSVLSLVLPALGVVSFPEQFISTNVEHRKSIMGQSDSPIEAPLTHLARHAEEAAIGLTEKISSLNASAAGQEQTNQQSDSSSANNVSLNQSSTFPARFANFGSGAPQPNTPPNSGLPQNSSPNALEAFPPIDQRNWGAQGQATAPVGPASASPGSGTGFTVSGTTQAQTQQLPPPGKSVAAVNGFGWEPDLKTRKVGTGIWLLLGPVWMLALLVWSLSPSPSSSKSSSSKKKS